MERGEICLSYNKATDQKSTHHFPISFKEIGQGGGAHPHNKVLMGKYRKRLRNYTP